MSDQVHDQKPQMPAVSAPGGGSDGLDVADCAVTLEEARNVIRRQSAYIADLKKQIFHMEESREKVKAEIPQTSRFHGRLIWDCVRMLREDASQNMKGERS